MMFHQRNDKICFRDQGMGPKSAGVIGKKIIGGNDHLCRIDLSNNMLQQNFKSIVQGIKSNKRLISLVMRNNQLNG